MDENKEYFAHDDENTTVDETAAADEAAAVEDIAAVEANTDTMNTEDNPPAAPKKKGMLNRTIIISAAIVGVVLVAALVCRLFLSGGIQGASFTQGKSATTWRYTIAAPTGGATSDEAASVDYYFRFEPNEKLKIRLGSFVYNGTYKIQHVSQKDAEETEELKDKVGKSIVNIENTGGMIDGKFFMETTGNAFQTQTLTLTNIYSDEVKLELERAEFVPVEIKRDGEFSKDKKAVGSWEYKNEMLSNTITLTDDGQFVVKNNQSSGLVFSYSGIYNCKDGNITMSYFESSRIDADFKYTVDGDTLNLYQQVQKLDPETGKIIVEEEPIAFNKVK